MKRALDLTKLQSVLSGEHVLSQDSVSVTLAWEDAKSPITQEDSQTDQTLEWTRQLSSVASVTEEEKTLVWENVESKEKKDFDTEVFEDEETLVYVPTKKWKLAVNLVESPKKKKTNIGN